MLLENNMVKLHGKQRLNLIENEQIFNFTNSKIFTTEKEGMFKAILIKLFWNFRRGPVIASVLHKSHPQSFTMIG